MPVSFHVLDKIIECLFGLLRFSAPFLGLNKVLVDHLTQHGQSLTGQLHMLIVMKAVTCVPVLLYLERFFTLFHL